MALSMFTGFMRGFWKEVIALAAWVIAIWLAFSYTPVVAVWLAPYIHEQPLRFGLAFLGIILAVLLAGSATNATVGFILRHAGLRGADRVLGMGFGFIRGALIISLLLTLAVVAKVDLKPYQVSSRFYPYFVPAVKWRAGAVQPLLVHERGTESKAQSQG